MPIYQYECSDCGDVFEHLWRSFAQAGNEHAACPQCGSTTTRTLFPGTAIGPRRLTVPRSKEPGEHKEVVVPESVPEDERPLPSTPGAWQVLEPEDMGDPSSHEAMQAISGAPGWFLVGASLRGRQHAHEGRYREDAFVIACHNGWNIAAVADGAGSASLARVGARVATQACVDSLARNLEGPEEMELSEDTFARTRSLIELALQEAQNALVREAQVRQVPLRELSTTLLTAAHRPVATGHLLCTGQVGDGLIAAASRSEGVLLLGSPQYGKFANETQFLTHLKAPSDFRARVSQEQQLPSDLRFLVLLTDGVADDFLPAKSQLPRLFEHLPGILGLGHVAAPQQLMALLRYSKRGSFDDRTAVVIGLCGDPGVCS